jgi:anhydro-N-acetylmuramic acid kinase
MTYRAIGLMSGSSLDGLDIAFVEFEETGGSWSFRLEEVACMPYEPDWQRRLSGATVLSARDYQVLHSDYGHYIGRKVNAFIEERGLQYRVGLIASHGHTTFHQPPVMTGQIGCGAAIAAETGLPVVSDLRAMDVALGGQGAPIVPMGEKLLFPGYRCYLNIGGIANITVDRSDGRVAFDTSPANRVLNLLSLRLGMPYDEGGRVASEGRIDERLLSALDALDYYGMAYPKSLANDFGTDVVLPVIDSFGLETADALRTFTEHIAVQVQRGLASAYDGTGSGEGRLLITGGGALNGFLVSRISELAQPLGIAAEAADETIASYKEALIMALLGVLRWREEETVMASVTGARRSSVGGALWMGLR